MNKYEVLSTIGEGEYGVVRKARNRQNEELVAIKKFKEDTDEENKKIILRQVKVLKMMKHENITEFKEAFRKKGRVYLICEYVERNLLQIMEEVRCLEPERVKYFMYQLLKGLEYMHSIDLIHRDLKPENLLINSDDTLKICDFGFTRTVSNSKMTDYVATRWYRAPELLLSRDDYDKSVDIWAAGCIFAEMIDSEPLFPGESQVDQLFLMQRCLGPLSPDHQEYFLKHPRFVGVKFPEVNTIQSLDRRYMGKLDKEGLDLLKKMLRMNPRERVTASEALKRPYFTKIAGLEKSTAVITSTRRSNAMSTNFEGVSPHLPFPDFKTNKDERDRIKDDKTISKEQKFKDEKIGLNTNKVTGVNKIKGVNSGATVTEEASNLLYPTKSKIIQNIQNKISMNPGTKSDNRAPQQADKLIKKEQFQYLLQKKTKSPEDNRNYIPDFEEEAFRQETPILKSRDNFRRKKMVDDDQQLAIDDSSRTPTITKMLKKKLSKYNGVFHPSIQDEPKRRAKDDHYDADELDCVALGNFRREQAKEQGNYNIVFNNNTFNYNYRK